MKPTPLLRKQRDSYAHDPSDDRFAATKTWAGVSGVGRFAYQSRFLAGLAIVMICVGQTCMNPRPDDQVGGYRPGEPINPAGTVETIADAGDDRDVEEGSLCWLDGRLSSGNGALVYAWQQLTGTPVELSSYDQPLVSFTAPAPAADVEELTFQLLVQDAYEAAGAGKPVVVSDQAIVRIRVKRGGADVDSDGFRGTADNCPNASNPDQADTDGDGVGDACDNCIEATNADQADTDGDAAGDACDLCPEDPAKTEPGFAGCGSPEPGGGGGGGFPPPADADGDGVSDDTDNCVDTPNADQADCDANGVGNACQAIPTPLLTVMWSPASPAAGDTVTFQANPAAPDKECVLDWYLANGGTLTWEFGDGKTAEGNPVSTVYDATGTYTVKVTLVLTALGLGTLSGDQRNVTVASSGATIAPIITDVPNHTATAGVAYTRTPTLTQGTSPVTWSLTPNPAGMTINPSTGVVSWPNPVAGTHTVTVHAGNGAGSDDESWTLMVLVAPVIADIPNHSAPGGAAYSRTPALTQGSTPITWSLVSGPSGVTVNSSTGVVAWPSPVVGTNTIAIRATNAIGSDNESWTLTITPVPPVIADVPDHAATAGAAYTRTPTLSQGTTPVTWSLVTGPTGMTVNSTTGVVSWATPTAGVHAVAIRAANAAGSDDESWSLTVNAAVGTPAIAVWAYPDGNTVTGTAHIGVVAYHATGIQRVDFRVDSGPTTSITEETINPDTNEYEFVFNLDTTQLGNGSHIVYATAVPRAGKNTALPSLLIQVANGVVFRTWYVDANTGDDVDGNGTSATPYKTIDRACQEATGGDTVRVRSGSYAFPDSAGYGFTRYVTITPDTGASVWFPLPAGTILRSGFLKFDGLTFTTPGNETISIYGDGSHSWFRNCVFIGRGKDDPLNDGPAVYGRIGSSHIIFEYNQVHDKDEAATCIGDGRYIFRGNHVYDQTGTPFVYDGTHILITGNHLHNLAIPPGSTGHMDFLSSNGGVSDLIIRNNRCYEGAAQGLKFGGFADRDYHAENVAIVNNLLSTSLNGGIVFRLQYKFDAGGVYTFNNWLIAHNTFWHPEGVVKHVFLLNYVANDQPVGLQGFVIVNNIMGQYSVADYKSLVDGGYIQMNYNRHNKGTATGSHSTVGDPGFVDASSDHYALTITSDCHERATTEPLIAYDLLWQPRSKVSPSIGAYE